MRRGQIVKRVSAQEQRKTFDEIAKKLNIRRMEVWYQVTKKQVTELGGSSIVNSFEGSLLKSLANIYPEFDWKPWKFSHVPANYWKDVANHRFYFDSLAKEMKLKSIDDWYNVTDEDVTEHDGGNLLQSYYGGSLSKALAAVYPNHQWRNWKFARTPAGYWQNSKNQKVFLEQLGEELHVKKLEDWYQVTHQDLKTCAYGKGEYVNKFESFQRLLAHQYPEFPWVCNPELTVNSPAQKMWKFALVPDGFWSSTANQRAFLDDCAEELGVRELSDWYKIERSRLNSKANSMIDSYYGGSLALALKATYPDFSWQMWRFVNPPNGTWKDKKNQREFFDHLAKKLNVNKWQDWYAVKTHEVAEHSSAVLDLYGGSLSGALVSIYPEHPWRIWNFVKLPNKFWDNEANVSEFLQAFAKENNIRELDDWYPVTHVQIEMFGGETLLNREGGLTSLLMKYLPDHDWEPSRFIVTKKYQNLLFRFVNEIFGWNNVDIHHNYYHPHLHYQSSGMNMELDIYIPAYDLAFEYQGKQHFGKEFLHVETGFTVAKDREKRDGCKKIGVTLIEVPFWWNQRKESLVSTIRKRRPDLEKFINLQGTNEEWFAEIPERWTVKQKNGQSEHELRVGQVDVPSHSEEELSNNTDPVRENSPSSPFKRQDYILSSGIKQGGLSKCRGCLKRFDDVYELRIQTLQSFAGKKIKAHFCLNSSCIENGIKQETLSLFPPFTGKVFVSKEEQGRAKRISGRDLPEITGIHWIQER